MTRADNTDHLRRAAADRRDAATRRTIAVIDEFDRTGAAVTIAGIASAAGVSRSWLYEQPDLLAGALQLRDRTGTPSLPTAQRASNESLRQRLDAARTEIEHLRMENVTLRDQLARALGQARTHR
ncbi:MAG: DUF6262 family protein [Acidimicrobiales bacterium]|nr:DUF6262 family protein [Acidimicrobiales bacterium]